MYNLSTSYTPQSFNFGGNVGNKLGAFDTGIDPNMGGTPMSAQGFFGGGRELGFNAPTIGAGLSGLATIGNVWNAWQSQKLAKQQFKYTRGVTETNLANSIASYNTALSDRARSRGAMEGQSQSQIDQYVNDNRAVRR